MNENAIFLCLTSITTVTPHFHYFFVTSKLKTQPLPLPTQYKHHWFILFACFKLFSLSPSLPHFSFLIFDLKFFILKKFVWIFFIFCNFKQFLNPNFVSEYFFLPPSRFTFFSLFWTLSFFVYFYRIFHSLNIKKLKKKIIKKNEELKNLKKNIRQRSERQKRRRRKREKVFEILSFFSLDCH